MRQHIDFLGILHMAWGAFGILTGVSLGILAIGMRAALAGEMFGAGERAAVAVLALAGLVLVVGGAAMVMTGWALKRRTRRARLAALMLAVPNLVVVPFGTALGVYTFWGLLNNDARLAFGRTPRAATPLVP